MFLTYTLNPGTIFNNGKNPIKHMYYCKFCKYNYPFSPNIKHCERCGVCFIKQDHHCGVFGKCIAKNNIACFYLFLLLIFWLIFGTAGSFIYILLTLFN